MKHLYLSGPDKLREKQLALIPAAKNAHVVVDDIAGPLEWRRRDAFVRLIETAKPGDIIVIFAPRYAVANLTDLISLLSILALRELGLSIHSLGIELTSPEQISFFLVIHKAINAIVNDTKGAAISHGRSRKLPSPVESRKSRPNRFDLLFPDIAQLLKKHTIPATALILGINSGLLYAYLKKHPELLPTKHLRKERPSRLDKHKDELKKLLPKKTKGFIAKHFDISRQALDNYLDKHPSLKKAAEHKEKKTPKS